ncbi:MAG: hypothetical protein ACRDD1_12915 [Planctomycetia bacterium]
MNNENGGSSMAANVNLLLSFARVHALCLTVFLRRDYGSEGIGMTGLGAFVLIPAYAGLANSHAMLLFWGFWFLAVVSQRMRQYRNWRNGVVLHSRYEGYPWVAFKLFPRIRAEGDAKAAEAFLAFGVGGVLTYLDKPLGWFVMAGFLSILFVEAISEEITRKRLSEMKDAQLEQQYLARRFRSGRF